MDDCRFYREDRWPNAHGAREHTCKLKRKSLDGCDAGGGCPGYLPPLHPSLVDGVPPGGCEPAGPPTELGGESGDELVVLSHTDLPKRDTEPECPDGGPQIRPLVFGVAEPGNPDKPFPVFSMVCGVALDGGCPSPCYFGMYSRDISRAHEGTGAARVVPFRSLREV